MSPSTFALVCGILGSLAVVACSHSSSRSDAAADAKAPGDEPAYGGKADVVVTPDVPIDVEVSAGADASTDQPSGAVAADTASPIDGMVSVDVDTPMDVATAIDVVTPVDGIVPIDVTRPDLQRNSDAGKPCVVDADCGEAGIAVPAKLRCGYLIADACSAKGKGTCVTTPPGLPCTAIIMAYGCGCDGKPVGWTGGCRPELPDGYAPTPLSHTGACP